MSGDFRGCNTLTGRFDVLDIGYGSGDVINRFAANFEQHCEGAVPALRGEIRFNIRDPSVPVANAGPDARAVSGQRRKLDGSGSTDADGAIVAYAWRQIAGPAVQINRADRAVATFDVPAVTSEQTLSFELMVTDNRGFRNLDQVSFVARPPR